MKKLVLLVVGVVAFCLSTQKAQAQDKDFFVGKWNILVTGTPKGDATSVFTFEKVDGKLTGTMVASGKPAIKMSRIEVTAKDITAYFTSDSGYEVYMFLEKKDDNHVEGSMMDMFECTGERVVEKK